MEGELVVPVLLAEMFSMKYCGFFELADVVITGRHPGQQGVGPDDPGPGLDHVGNHQGMVVGAGGLTMSSWSRGCSRFMSSMSRKREEIAEYELMMGDRPMTASSVKSPLRKMKKTPVPVVTMSVKSMRLTENHMNSRVAMSGMLVLSTWALVSERLSR
jgi:hypothetical protein